jgi:KUP system potassium uptake protein
MALTALALRTANASPRILWLMSALGIFGAALFYGDAVITPAMSVLSAVEGLEVVTPLDTLRPADHDRHPGPAVLFSAARHGGRRRAVRPADDVLVRHPRRSRPVERDPVSARLLAINPWYALSFIHRHQGLAFLALGSVVLAITGGEALYADMGHFGRRSIKWAWFAFVFRCCTSTTSVRER